MNTGPREHATCGQSLTTVPLRSAVTRYYAWDRTGE